MLQLQNAILARLISSRPLPLAFPPILGIVNSIGVVIGGRAFHSYTVIFKGLNREDIISSNVNPFQDTHNELEFNPMEPMEVGKLYTAFLVGIHSANFWVELEAFLHSLTPGFKYTFIMDAPMAKRPGNHTVGRNFHWTPLESDFSKLREYLEPIIIALEEKYDDEFISPNRARVVNKGPHTPSTSQPTKFIKNQIKSQLESYNTNITSKMNAKMEVLKTDLLNAIKSNTSITSTPSQATDWTPLVTALAALVSLSPIIISKYLGISLPSNTTSTTHTDPGEVQTPSNVLERINQLEASYTSIKEEVSNIKTQNEANYTSIKEDVTALKSSMESNMANLLSAISSIKSNNGNNSDGSTPPAAPTSASTPPTSSASQKSSPKKLVEIKAAKPAKTDKIGEFITADLEAIITPEGSNQVFMAAWYNGKTQQIYSLTDPKYQMNSTLMLEDFWFDLINLKQKIVYFHNWGGYDSILSLLPLVNHNKSGLIFQPLVNPSNQLISLKVLQQLKDKNVGLLTIKDSIKLLPGALGKLAKDFQVETQKDHFPHYFFLDSLKDTLSYEGQLPEYKFFEPKRTSKADYDVMVEEFKNKPWSFFKVSKTYISGDIKSLYQILQVYFSNLSKQFPINPLSNLSVPGIAFKIWKTQQLPILNKDNLKVYDLSGSLDSEFREAYKGGILDVYRPHLKGEGYYYDVNSLYPTAMSKAMPVGTPTKINLTVEEFLEAYFFGYVKAIVNAPPTEYIGLLSIKYQGRLISPIGTFEGMFFSDFCHRNYIY